MATIYYDDDADLGLLFDKTVAVLGYGSPRTRPCVEPAGQRRERNGRAT